MQGLNTPSTKNRSIALFLVLGVGKRLRTEGMVRKGKVKGKNGGAEKGVGKKGNGMGLGKGVR